MNTKEVSELRRRWQAGKNAVKRIYGCYVSASGGDRHRPDEPLSLMPQEEAEQYFALLKKALSGKLGEKTCLTGVLHPAGGGQRRAPAAHVPAGLGAPRPGGPAGVLSKSRGKPEAGRAATCCFWPTTPTMCPPKPRMAPLMEDGENVFSYILCAVCPVKEGKPGLGYYAGNNEFHCFAPQTVAAPECGFLFPAFDDRAANLYNALSTAASPMPCPRNSWRAYSTPMCPWPRTSRRRPSGHPWRRPWGRPAAWMWCRWCTASWKGCWRSTERPAATSPHRHRQGLGQHPPGL